MTTPQGLNVVELDAGILSSNSGSVSGSSTRSILNLLPYGPDLTEAFRELKSRLRYQSSELNPSNRNKWLANRERLARLIWNHTANPYQIRRDTSYEASEINGRLVVIIGCKSRDAKDQVQDIIEGSGALYFVRETLGFHDIRVDMKFKGHLARGWSLGSGLVSGKSNLQKRPILGMSMDLSTERDTYTPTTLGGVILVDGTPYALAAGYAFMERLGEKREDGEMVVCSYGASGIGRLPETTRGSFAAGNKATSWTNGKDWALVSIPVDMIPPNTIVNAESLEDWPWTSSLTSLHAFPLLVQKTINEKELALHMSKEGGSVACLAFPMSSPTPRAGYIAAGTSTIILNGTMHTVLRVDMLSPIEYGDSGSWVLVGNAVCGIIIAGTGRSDEFGLTDDASEEQLVFSAYVLPMNGVMANISDALHVEVSLPTLVDHRIDFLRCHTSKWDISTKALPRALDMEFLLGQRKQGRRGHKSECLQIDTSLLHTAIPRFYPKRLSGLSSFILESIGLHFETIQLLLPLGECLETEAGENLLGLLIFLWKSQRKLHITVMSKALQTKRRIGWLAQLLCSLFSVMSTSKIDTPSTQELESFIYCIISVFKDKDLKHLYLIPGARSRKAKASASTSLIWFDAPPSRPNLFKRGSRFVKNWVSGSHHDAADQIGVDRAIGNLPTLSRSWDHSIAALSRVLVLLHTIYTSTREQVLVCYGKNASWVAFYADMLLGLDVSYRMMTANGARPMSPEFARLSNNMTGGRPDVVVYFDDHVELAEIYEIVDRVDVGQELVTAYTLNHSYLPPVPVSAREPIPVARENRIELPEALFPSVGLERSFRPTVHSRDLDSGIGTIG
ncbi:hypothetical protein FAUST_6488 [Fusarium austroamericanum]|uniref:Uncharacterized protein n=1 Tax=Fusarium austroamericanum TaxID=282268 RepID=A0AAN5Z8F8_FUSAU|nr:hypothetical protein FAUST_6488 [Fusarium austroamericanum]